MNTKLSWDEIILYTNNLVQQILASNFFPDTILAINRGGLIPAGLISYKLNIRHVHTIGISSYDKQNQKGQLDVLHIPEIKEKSKNLLIVDDICDSGSTMKFLTQSEYLTNYCYNFKTAVIINKSSNNQMDFVGQNVFRPTWIDFPWEK